MPWFSFFKADRRVTCFYFYLWDIDFGPAFIKICVYFPYPIKVWLNGHEWAKRQATQAGIEFTELSNGFATCADPALQAICHRLGPGTIGVFFERWMSRLPLPLTAARTNGTPAARTRRQKPASSTASPSPASPAATTQSAIGEETVSAVTRVSNTKKDQVYTLELT